MATKARVNNFVAFMTLLLFEILLFMFFDAILAFLPPGTVSGCFMVFLLFGKVICEALNVTRVSCSERYDFTATSALASATADVNECCVCTSPLI